MIRRSKQHVIIKRESNSDGREDVCEERSDSWSDTSVTVDEEEEEEKKVDTQTKMEVCVCVCV